MNCQGFVCPNDKALLGSFTGYAVAVRVNDPGDIADAAANVRETGNELFCVILHADRPLSEIVFREDQAVIPLAIVAPAMGDFRTLAKSVDLLRRSNLRIFLPCDNFDNLSALRILSSLGIYSCADFAASPYDWEAITDLMTYAVLGRAPHAPIEPFAFIAANYDPHSILRWGSIEFDDPAHFLHLDAQGQVSLSRDELQQGIFIAPSIGGIEPSALSAAIDERANAWRHYFVDNHPCASCAGWKICLGRFSGDLPDDAGCAKFFSELIDVAAMLKAPAPQHDEGGIWRP